MSEKTRLDWETYIKTGEKVPHKKTYAERSTELAEQQGEGTYAWTYWAEPAEDLELEIVRFIRQRHPRTITLSLQSVVDEIRDFVALKSNP